MRGGNEWKACSLFPAVHYWMREDRSPRVVVVRCPVHVPPAGHLFSSAPPHFRRPGRAKDSLLIPLASLDRLFGGDAVGLLDPVRFQPVPYLSPYLRRAAVALGQGSVDQGAKVCGDAVGPGHRVNIQRTCGTATGQSLPLPDQIAGLT